MRIVSGCFQHVDACIFSPFRFRQVWETLLSHSRNVISKQVHGKSLFCSKCKQTLSIFQSTRTGFRNRFVIDHACKHLEKDLFFCRYCEVPSTSRTTMNGHVRKVHGLSGDPKNYVNVCSDYKDDIMDMMSRCFDPREAKNIADADVKLESDPANKR